MKKVILILLIVGVLFSCKEDTIEDENYLVFGHFYGMCIGDACVVTYKLTDKRLYKNALKGFNQDNFDFKELDNEKFELVKDLKDDFPQELLKETNNFIGCPDCADGGGLFIELSRNGTVKEWYIDQNKGNVPNYLHDFMDKVNAKISQLEK